MALAPPPPRPSSDAGPFLGSAVPCPSRSVVKLWRSGLAVVFSDFLCASEASKKEQLKEERAEDRYAKHRLTSDLGGS